MSIQITNHVSLNDDVNIKTRVFDTFLTLEIEDVVYFLNFDQYRAIGEHIENYVNAHLEAVALAQFDAQRDSEYSLS